MLHPSRKQRPSEKGRGGLPTMTSHGVEISIAGGVGEKVRAQPLGDSFFFSFFFYIMRSLFLGTRSFVQR